MTSTKVYYACECPTAHIKLTQQHTDFDFVIAHHVLEDNEYAATYMKRNIGRILILDNGFFELGAPLSNTQILEAAVKVNADFIVPPDHMGDFIRTKQLLKDFIKIKGKYKIAPVVVGSNPGELARCYDYYTNTPEVDMYCLAFGTERAAALKMVRTIDKNKPHHLLGFSTLKEFRSCLDIMQLPSVSLDTSKPVNAAYAGKIIKDLGRRSYVRPALDAKIDEKLLVKNIATFKGWLANENL